MQPFLLMLAFFVLPPFMASAQSSTIVTKSFYTIEIDYPDPVSWFGGSVLGLAPKKALYRETWKSDTAHKNAFRLELVADEKEQWFLVDPDSSVQSFAHFPRTDLKNLGKDAALLAERILRFLACKDSCSTLLWGALHVDTSEIVAQFHDRMSWVIPDSKKIQLRGTHSRFVAVNTRDANTATPYITGNILIERVNGYTVYPYVSAYLYDQRVRIKLYLQRFLIEYK